tara:strand:- start:20583 stop:20927 length:345 start_codon:yes stop_codon:yes gene_type:complete
MVSAQKEIQLKRKYFGKYKGEIAGYNIDTGEKIMRVSSSAIYIEISKNEISITIGNNKLKGSYEVMFKAQTYFLVDAEIEGQLATERIIIYKRGRKVARDGMFPQPVTQLKKYK